ncbi:hypothetical protein B0H13DRAFT_1882922 [Mycena leptocephala]|nr:hypothetical protein B0H13DRAFT_1882922 [Mycena leptocephala]
MRKAKEAAEAFGLFLWATGSAWQTIDTAFRCGLSVGYDSVLRHIGLTADGSMDNTIEMAEKPHRFNYDNMNISTSIFVEQCGARGPAKATSGTFGILYGLRNATWENMLIEPIMKRFLGFDHTRRWQTMDWPAIGMAGPPVKTSWDLTTSGVRKCTGGVPSSQKFASEETDVDGFQGKTLAEKAKSRGITTAREPITPKEVGFTKKYYQLRRTG